MDREFVFVIMVSWYWGGTSLLVCFGVCMCEWGVSSHGQLSEFRYTGAVCIYLSKPGPLGEKEK